MFSLLTAIAEYISKFFHIAFLKVMFFVLVAWIFSFVLNTVAFVFYHYGAGLSIGFGALCHKSTIQMLLYMFSFSWILIIVTFVYNIIKD